MNMIQILNNNAKEKIEKKMCGEKIMFGILLNVLEKMVNVQVVLMTIQVYVMKLQKQQKE